MKSNTNFSALYRLLPKLQKLYPLLLFLVVVWLCWLLARLVWLMVAPPSAPAITPVALQASQNNVPMGNGLDIFARPEPTQTVNQPPPDVKVLGVTIASPKALSFAILASNGKVKSYKIGEMLDGSAYQLAEVTNDHIILSQNGQTSKVDFGSAFALDQREQAGNTNNAQNPNGAMLSGNVLTNTPKNSMPNPSPAPTNIPMQSTPTQADNSASINPATDPANASPLDSTIAGLQENPSGYLSQMGVATTGNGYLVTDGMPSGIKDRLGLQSGDRVISVNGQNVGENPSQDAQLLEQVKQSGQAQIQVQRGEQTITLRQSF